MAKNQLRDGCHGCAHRRVHADLIVCIHPSGPLVGRLVEFGPTNAPRPAWCPGFVPVVRLVSS